MAASSARSQLLLKAAGLGRARPNPERRQFFCLIVLLAAGMLLGPLVPSAPAASEQKFLIASDIHFDPMTDTTLVAELAAAAPAQWEAILQRSQPTTFSKYGEDTNWWLLQSALDQMRKTLPHPAFIMFTGDMLAHSFPKTYRGATHDENPEHYRAFVLKTVQFLALQLRKRFPDTKILLTPGNNDEECGNYSINAGGTFLSDTAGLAQDLAGASATFTDEWKALGSYNIPHPAIPGVRILSLNTVFFSDNYHALSFMNECNNVASTAAADLLKWLASNLEAAAQANQKVWLMFHIPPGIDGYMTTQKRDAELEATAPSVSESCPKTIVPMWVPEWTAQFDALLDTFHDTVLASLAGHTHTDDFRVISAAGVNRAFVLVDPAVSPVYGQNPSFRVVTFAGDGSLVDQSTYYLSNLRKAGSKLRGRWKREYRFSQKWKVRRLDLASLAKIYGEIAGGPEAREQWLKLYNVSSSAVVVSTDAVRGLYCAIAALDPASYQRCYCGTATGQTATDPQP